MLTVSGCASDQPGTGPAPQLGSDSSRAPALTGALTVFAAASLTESFSDLRATLKASAPGLALTYSFGASGPLVSQVIQGAPADVIATADEVTMKRLTDASLVEAPVIFARNQLEILVAPGNPRGVKALADLARSDLKVVLADDTVPAGRYAAEALAAAGTTVSPVSREVDVKSAAAKVILGEADATIVYVTDVTAAGSRGEGIAIPPAFNVVAEYPLAIVKEAPNRAAAAALVESLVEGAGQDALRRRGFLPPPR